MTRPSGLMAIFGWPAAIAVTSLAGLVLALFVDGAWDVIAAAIISLPLLAAALASARSTLAVPLRPARPQGARAGRLINPRPSSAPR